MSKIINSLKIGYIGCGHMAQALIRGQINYTKINPSHIFATNRTDGKLIKFASEVKINALKSNEELADQVTIIVLSVKPVDLKLLMEDLTPYLTSKHILISLAAGIKLNDLQKFYPTGRFIRAVPNLPVSIGSGAIGYSCQNNDPSLIAIADEFFGGLGTQYFFENEDNLDAFLVATSSGIGFIYEFMTLFEEWVGEHEFSSETSKQMVLQTFLGATQLALSKPENTFEELQNQVASKKGVTAAGLNALREFELDRVIRLGLDAAQKQNEDFNRILVY